MGDVQEPDGQSPQPGEPADDPEWRAGTRPSDVRPWRRHLLRGIGGREDSSYPVLHWQPAADRSGIGDDHFGHRPFECHLRRDGIDRPRRADDLICVGPRCRWCLRRLDERAANLALFDACRLQRAVARHRQSGSHRRCVNRDYGEQHRADRDHQLAIVRGCHGRWATSLRSPAVRRTRRTVLCPPRR